MGNRRDEKEGVLAFRYPEAIMLRYNLFLPGLGLLTGVEVTPPHSHQMAVTLSHVRSVHASYFESALIRRKEASVSFVLMVLIPMAGPFIENLHPVYDSIHIKKQNLKERRHHYNGIRSEPKDFSNSDCQTEDSIWVRRLML